MKISRQARRKAKALFRLCLEGEVLDPERVRRVVGALIDQKPRGYLAILHRLRQLIAYRIAEKTLSIESAAPLPDEGRSLFAELEARYGPALEKRYSVRPELIGGIRIQRGSTVWDGSINRRLQTLATSLA
ncbi:F-type H+-transporting ATPase subunit delta [Methylacidimicrobium cyclopophantes]|uniref:F-type H+-transporting ATPase subunit delta n=1 Tax=Methylacidimicrobium cyclopophantes TaxID=1041766 RepID=A0A5E6MH11_9BACT|nr:F0F1 ATP synthase subunit delta [Methylacidimicrobium cyclopophantes]VVM04765.1 F-type H+-transporting ATPase subunit delta [Methylacidimicrobium cyclopophantes]